MANPVPTGITSPPTKSVDTSSPVASGGSEKRRKLNCPMTGGADKSGTSVTSLPFSRVNSCTAATRRVARSTPAMMMDCSNTDTTPTSCVASYTVSDSGAASSDGASVRV